MKTWKCVTENRRRQNCDDQHTQESPTWQKVNQQWYEEIKLLLNSQRPRNTKPHGAEVSPNTHKDVLCKRRIRPDRNWVVKEPVERRRCRHASGAEANKKRQEEKVEGEKRGRKQRQ